jgi:hypothetical protein
VTLINGQTIKGKNLNETLVLNYTIDEIDLIYIHRSFNPIATQNAFCLPKHSTFCEKENSKKQFEQFQTISCIF